MNKKEVLASFPLPIYHISFMQLRCPETTVITFHLEARFHFALLRVFWDISNQHSVKKLCST
jgi:hypothetical protein